MNNFKRHFTEEAFLFSTFVEFNKCWSSGKKSRLVIESFNGFAFVNFSAFLGHPKTMHSAPRERPDPGRKSRKKSKQKTQRDNERAARFQERKRQEREAAVSEASKENLPSPSVTSPPALSAASSPRVEFNFSKPAPADVSENSDSSKMTIDGNETLPSGEMKEASSGERNSLSKKYSPGVFYGELKELTTSDLDLMSSYWHFHEFQSEKEVIEAMPTKEIRTTLRELEKQRDHCDSGEKYDFDQRFHSLDCDEDWEVMLYLQQLLVRERERWHKEQPGL